MKMSEVQIPEPQPESQLTPPLLELRGVSKSFPGVVALRDANLSVRAGEVHALLGENGAGKSTLIKVITGAHSPDSGELEVEGERIVHTETLLDGLGRIRDVETDRDGLVYLLLEHAEGSRIVRLVPARGR